MGEHLIKVENLTLSYENMTVVKDLSFTVESGDYLCIVGENGSGKSTLVKSLLSLKKPSLAVRRRPVLILLLSIVFVPLVVAGAKYFTNVYCPYQLNIYNGLYPFVRIIDNYPESFVQPKPGRCFPAGHATTGFAFMALYFVFDSRRGKILGLLAGILLGLAAGFYQMLRGQHFLSHTLFSMIASFAVIITIDWFVSKNTKK